MKSKEAIKSRLRLLREQHGKEPSPLEYSENHGRIDELEWIIKEHCSTCNMLHEEFVTKYHNAGVSGSVDDMVAEVNEQRGILAKIHDHLVDVHV